MNVAVIPARGGSKRIPGKNIRPFAGRPMIARSIECALTSGLFERTIVSTDDESIADVARSCGAEVPFTRPPELADDHTGITEVVAHAITWLEQQKSFPAAVCCITATAPFLRSEDLARGMALLRSGPWKYVFAATAFSYPIFRSFEILPTGGVRMFFPDRFGVRSQDLPVALHDAGQFYWGLPSAWAERARIFDEWSTTVVIPPWRVQDIDTLDDWKRAEFMMTVLTEMEKHADVL